MRSINFGRVPPLSLSLPRKRKTRAGRGWTRRNHIRSSGSIPMERAVCSARPSHITTERLEIPFTPTRSRAVCSGLAANLMMLANPSPTSNRCPNNVELIPREPFSTWSFPWSVTLSKNGGNSTKLDDEVTEKVFPGARTKPWSGLLHVHPAVDRQHLPSDVARARATSLGRCWRSTAGCTCRRPDQGLVLAPGNTFSVTSSSNFVELPPFFDKVTDQGNDQVENGSLGISSTLFGQRLEVGLGFASIIKLAASPEQTAREQVEVNGIFHRSVVMCEGRAEHTALSIGIDPDDRM